MNIENMNKLRSWLLAGAPHAILNMSVSIDIANDNGHFEDNDGVEVLIDQQGKGDCGTACCIAGAAHLMKNSPEGHLFPPLDEQKEFDAPWTSTRDSALKWLGLPRGHVFGGTDDFYDRLRQKGITSGTDEADAIWQSGWFGHELFSSDLAPENCTPDQAAQAVQNVIDGKRAWEGII